MRGRPVTCNLFRSQAISVLIIAHEYNSAQDLVSEASPLLPEDRAEVDKRIKSFKPLKENQYLCKRVVNKQSKKMQCDCTYSKEEMNQGEKGCGDDCLNRLLYIECGKSCILDSNCSNKRFLLPEQSSKPLR